MIPDSNEKLLQRFTEKFRRLDPFAETLDALRGSSANSLRIQDEWYLVRHETPPAALDDLYRFLPARFPPLFETLLLSYRWTEVELCVCRLIPNAYHVDSLFPFRTEMMKDRSMSSILLANRYMQFGRGTGLDYDPVCFDAGDPAAHELPIVKIDHEEILCNGRIVIAAPLAGSFNELLNQVIAQPVHIERDVS